MATITTYHDPAADKCHCQDELIALWRKSWEKAGWQTAVLGPEAAQRHRFYNAITKSSFLRLTVNDWDYAKAAYCKWLAMATIGGGWYADPDVMNYGLLAEKVTTISPSCYVADFMPCLLYGEKSFYEGMSRTIRNIAMLQHAGAECVRDDLNDMNIFRDYWRGMVNEMPICLNYLDPHWEQAPLVHYHVTATGLVNRAELIQKVRPC